MDRRLTGERCVFIAAFALAASHGLFALDPDRSITQYGIDKWGEQNGLPQDKVQAITQTADGYLWIGTLHGLAMFDGVRFTRFVPKDAPELETASVHGLYTAKDGSLWIGTDFDGVAHWQDGRTRWYRAKEGLGTEIRTIREDRNGTFWSPIKDSCLKLSIYSASSIWHRTRRAAFG